MANLSNANLGNADLSNPDLNAANLSLTVLFSLFLRGQWFIFVRMSRIVRFESNMVRPLSHFLRKKMAVHRFVDSVIKPTFLIAMFF